MNKFEIALLEISKKLDASMDISLGIYPRIKSVITDQDDLAVVEVVRKIDFIQTKHDVTVEVLELSNKLRENLIRYIGYITINNMLKHNEINARQDISLKQIIDELNSLVGLEKVKETVNDLIYMQKVRILRGKHGLTSEKCTLHLAFTGNPGTGKTTVARIVGLIYKRLGLLSKGHFIEVSRTDLIAGYQGQTALKVKKVIESAKGGVLFIDEAYSITENEHTDSYGRECLTELTKALEDYRDDLVVIVAGYTEPMNKFFSSNPGLRSRFNTFIEFDDYSADELLRILEQICTKNNYKLAMDLRLKLKVYMDRIVSEKKQNFDNGRLARNLFDNLVMNHARRVANIYEPSVEDLQLLLSCDFENLNKAWL